MERYIHLQTMPNSPLSPLTPLSENTAFDFNFGGDGSLDMYIDSVRQEHRVQQQQKKLLQQANRAYHKPGCPMEPKRYSEEFLKIREVFEAHDSEQEQNTSTISLKETPKMYCCNHVKQQQEMYVSKPKTSKIKITHTGATPTTKIFTSTQRILTPSIITNTQKNSDYVATPTNVRTPLKHRNQNILLNLPSKSYHMQPLQKIQQKLDHHQRPRQTFRQASPVAAKPLCPRVAKILHRNGLSIYSGLFQKEEIDLFAFKHIRLQDLHQMGIINPKHCELIMADIYYAGKYY